MEQLNYTPPEVFNLFTITALLFAAIAAADYLAAWLLTRRDGNKFRKAGTLLRAGSWMFLMSAAVAGTASLVSIEPISHLREWAETHQVELSDTNAKHLLDGRAVTKNNITYNLTQTSTGDWTLQQTPEPTTAP